MSYRVFTLAVWDVRRRCWAAFFTDPLRERVELMHVQLVNLVMVFAIIVEMPRDDDDTIVAALSLLPKVHPEAVFQSYFDLVSFVSGDEIVLTRGPLN